MEKILDRKRTMIAVCLLFCVALLTGCAANRMAAQNPPTVDAKAVFSIVYHPDGTLKVYGRNGEELKAKSLEDRIKALSQKKEWRLNHVKQITIYEISGSHEVWVCVNGNCHCELYDDNWNYIGPCPE